MKAAILNAAIEQLEARVKLLMFELNMLLSSGYKEGVALAVADKIAEVSRAQTALDQGVALRLQQLRLEAEAIAIEQKQENNTGE